MKPLIAGNWKMNGLRASLDEVAALVKKLGGAPPASCDVLICPPGTILRELAETYAAQGIAVGGEDCHTEASGAHTGDISAEMLADAGATYVIVGHSERRTDHGETDQLVKAKSLAAHRAGLIPIICVGETEAERKAGQEQEIVNAQLSGSLPPEGPYIVAYEPVWAIGTGLTPTIEDITKMHDFIRSKIGDAPHILYGGSVKPANAKEIFAIPNVNGGLVGGASLKADDFFGIIDAA